jgi:hypothetical protein
VQWFRAEAEMERWREEWEAKQADFLRCIRTFSKMADVWQTLSAHELEPERSSDFKLDAYKTLAGRIAYAKQKSAIFREMERHAKDTFRSAGYSELVDQLIDRQEGKILADFVLAERSHPKYHIPELIIGVGSVSLLRTLYISHLIIFGARPNLRTRKLLRTPSPSLKQAKPP